MSGSLARTEPTCWWDSPRRGRRNTSQDAGAPSTGYRLDVGSVSGAQANATVGVAYAWYGYGLRFLPTSTAVTLTLAEPLTAAVLGIVVLDERLPPLGWVGAALIVLGLALTARRPVTPIPE